MNEKGSLRLRGRLNGAGPACDVLVAGGRIESISPAGGGPADAGSAEHLLLPPLTDLQHNGCLGRPFNDPTVSLDEHRERRRFLLGHGVGWLLPTLITAPLDRLGTALRNLVAARKADPDLAAAWPGFHIEGPWISPDDGFRGAHERAYVIDPVFDDFRRLQDAADGLIRILTLAPERTGAIPFIEQVAATGVIVSLAHANPDDECVRAAVAAGASMVTHFGNGMTSQIHRHRNPLWSYLAEPGLRCGLIADGFHLPAPLLRSALAAKGADGAFLVSDAGDLSGLPPGDYPWGSKTLVIEANGYLHIKDSEYLAGAWFQLDECVARAARMTGMSLAETWRLGSSVPAAILDSDAGGPLRVGGRADIAVVRGAAESLKVEAIYLDGRRA